MNVTCTLLSAILLLGINKNPVTCLEKSSNSFKVFAPLQDTNYFFNSNNTLSTQNTNCILFTSSPKFQGKSISQVDNDCICINENGNYYIHFIANVVPKSNNVITLKVDGIPIGTTINDNKDCATLHKIIEVINAPVFLKFETGDQGVYLNPVSLASVSIIKLL